MEYRQLGRSGLLVSVLTLGTMTFGGRGKFGAVGGTDVAGASRQIDMCRDAGVNLIDTANIYSAGLSEEILGQALAGRRDEFLLATKARMATGPGPNDQGASRHHLIRACEASLKRLGTDHIDIYYLHEWDGLTPLEETLGALDDLVRAGKIRYIGASNFSAWQLMKGLAVSDRAMSSRFVTQQIHYSLQAREAEYELIPAAIDQGLGILVWSPLAGGLLSGKFRRDAADPESSRHLNGWSEPPVNDREALYDTIAVLLDVAAAHGVSAAQVALAWLLGRSGVSSLVIGARTDAQLADNLAAAALSLSAEERRRLDEVSALPLLYPYWHQARTAASRLSAADLSLLGPYL
jgi:aryl-alcohol dehydrogenase-like predicted oxidoreductase